jgi:trimethylamine:corrinoid methyltransferase-like protein
LDHLGKLVADLDVGRVREGAVRLLADVGMAVSSPDLAQRLSQAGIRVENGRMYIPPARTDAFMLRQRRIRGYTYELDGDRQRELRRIMDAARRSLCA